MFSYELKSAHLVGMGQTAADHVDIVPQEAAILWRGSVWVDVPQGGRENSVWRVSVKSWKKLPTDTQWHMVIPSSKIVKWKDFIFLSSTSLMLIYLIDSLWWFYIWGELLYKVWSMQGSVAMSQRNRAVWRGVSARVYRGPLCG